MELTYKGISEKAKWEKAGIVLPSFDIDTMVESTKKAPKWIHFGAGNIFRGFIAELQNKLLNSGVETSGIIASDTFDLEIIDQIYVPYDNLTLLVGLKPDGNTTKSVLASVAESVKDFERLKEIFAKESLQMVSFTITEKGYALTTMSGELLPIVKADIENGIHAPKHAMSLITALMYERYQKGAAAISLVSMDNCSHNGEKLQSSILQIASSWQDKGFVPVEFVEYLKDDTKVAFPWTMIDKITPRPAKVIEDMLVEVGVEDMSPITTSKNTFIAPFVNAEIPQYLVIEDKFPNGRPMLEKAGVYFTDRDTVNDTEKMKVTTCLNPLHTALAVYGCLLGYDSISSEMKDECLRKLVMKIGYDEGLPVVIDPGILSPMKFIKEVIEERLPNPFVPDMPQRIATDTSQKVPVRFGETIKSYVNSPELHVDNLVFIPLAIAGWLRYLLAIDDFGKEMELSSDPMLEELQKEMEGIVYGDPSTVKGQLDSILSNDTLFAVDLCKIGLAEKIKDMFIELISGDGAVRSTLEKYIY